MCSLNDEGKTPFHTFFRDSHRELFASYRTAAESMVIDDREMQLHHYIAWSSRATIADIEPFLGDDLQQCAKDDNGRTALFYAAECGNIEILTYLLGLPHAPSLVDTDFEGKSLIHYAVKSRSRCVETIDFLLQHGCNAHIVAKNGRTALHYAVWKYNLEGVKKLLTVDCSRHLSWRDNDGRTPLDLALSSSYGDDIAAYLSSLTTSSTKTFDAIDDGSILSGEVKTSRPWRLSPARLIDRVSVRSNSWRGPIVAAAVAVLFYYYYLSQWNLIIFKPTERTNQRPEIEHFHGGM